MTQVPPQERVIVRATILRSGRIATGIRIAGAVAALREERT